jgi:Ca-activated chloride channel family protein
LTYGQNKLLRKAPLTRRQVLPLLGGGLLAGLLAGTISQILFNSLAMYGSLAGVGRVLGWIVLGGILGFGMSHVIPNLPRKKAIAAGAAGGFCGALAFLAAVSVLPDFLARLLGALILGAAIGLMIALAEKLAREACLIVHWGPQERTVINLGERPIILGSSNEAELYLPKEKGFPPISALVTFREGKIEMQNKMTNTNHELKSGNKLQLGELLVEVRTDS